MIMISVNEDSVADGGRESGSTHHGDELLLNCDRKYSENKHVKNSMGSMDDIPILVIMRSSGEIRRYVYQAIGPEKSMRLVDMLSG
jgi:hypothetical protein